MIPTAVMPLGNQQRLLGGEDGRSGRMVLMGDWTFHPFGVGITVTGTEFGGTGTVE